MESHILMKILRQRNKWKGKRNNLEKIPQELYYGGIKDKTD